MKKLLNDFHTLTEKVADIVDIPNSSQWIWGQITDNDLIDFHLNTFYRKKGKNEAVDFMCKHMSMNAIYFIIGTFGEVENMDDLEKKVKILLNREYRTFIVRHPPNKKGSDRRVRVCEST